MVNKMPTRKVLILACTIIIFGAMMLLGAGIAYAATETPAPTPTGGATSSPTPLPPATLTSATYDVGKGELVLTGTNFAAVTGDKNDIDPTKLVLSDSFSHMYTLTAKKLEKASATSVTITVSDKDKAALAAWMDQAGTETLAKGKYNIAALPGWNGPTSKADLTNAVTVSGLTALTSATYDIKTKTLVLTATGLVATGKATDIDPKYLTISNGVDRSITISSSTKAVKIESPTKATIILSEKDAAALETILDKNGTEDNGAHAYNIAAAAGWNGPTSMGDLAGNAVTVSNYAQPVANTGTGADVTVEIGKTATVTSDKVGTIYLVSITNLTGATKAGLDDLVANGAATKVDIKKVGTGITVSIPTKGLKLSGSSVDFYLVAVDTAGMLSASLSSKKIVVTNVAAPALTVTAKAGTAAGTTTLTVTPATGDTISLKVFSTAPTTAPKVGDTPSSATAYTLNANISGVDATTNKYLAVYELDNGGLIVKYKLLTLTAAQINPNLGYSSVAIDSTKKIVTVTFTKDVINNLADIPALTAAITFAADGSIFAALGESDTVAITSGKLVITFNSALTGTTNKIKINADALKDATGKKNAAITTDAVDAS